MTQGNLKVMVGISGSGKSTIAASIFNESPENSVIVNRDKIREMLFGYTESNVDKYYKRRDFNKLEKEVTKFEDSLIKEGLSRGKTVIVDATHLKKEYINRFRYYNVDTSFVVCDVELDVALERVAQRERKVEPSVIKKQYKSFNLMDKNLFKGWEKETIDQNEDLPICVIFDLDGTLAIKSDRSPYDWSRVSEDTPDIPTFALAWASKKEIEDIEPSLFVCSGRDASCAKLSRDWMAQYNLKPDKCFFRKSGDNRPDWMVKKEMWQYISKSHYILFIVDDRCQVVDYARSLGLKVFQAEYSNF